MKTIAASGQILMCYETGDRPVLVLCADGHHYVCKYKLPDVPANKLLNELIGNIFAKSWGINTPVSSFIINDPIIWGNHEIRHDSFAPLFGSRKMDRPAYQLSESDSILTSNLYERLKKANVNQVKSALRRDYYVYVDKCKKSLSEIIDNIPSEWNIDATAVRVKIDSLFNSEWIEDTWDNFNDISNSV